MKVLTLKVYVPALLILAYCVPSIRAGGNLGDWAFCTTDSECINGCCSKEYSDDGKYKCTPGSGQCGGPNIINPENPESPNTINQPTNNPIEVGAGSLGDWAFCTTDSECS